jgi:hypothetical protein
MVLGLAVSAVTGLIGSFVDEGSDAQMILYSLAVIGGLEGATLLAVYHLRGGREMAAAGAGALAIVTAMGAGAGFAGEGSDAVFMSTSILWLPALWLIAFQDWSAMWTRGTAALSGLCFAIYGYTKSLGDEGPDPDSPLLIAAWALFILTLVGWIMTLRAEDGA